MTLVTLESRNKFSRMQMEMSAECRGQEIKPKSEGIGYPRRTQNKFCCKCSILVFVSGLMHAIPSFEDRISRTSLAWPSQTRPQSNFPVSAAEMLLNSKFALSSSRRLQFSEGLLSRRALGKFQIWHRIHLLDITPSTNLAPCFRQN